MTERNVTAQPTISAKSSSAAWRALRQRETCQHFVVSVAEDYLLASEDDLRADHYSGMSLELETKFGLKEHLYRDFFPASVERLIGRV